MDGLRSVDDLRGGSAAGHGQYLRDCMLELCEEDVASPPLVPGSAIAGRSELHVGKANRDYTICRAVERRLLRCALANLLTGEDRYREAVLRQIESLYDEHQWPDWRDLSHLWSPADLRTGQLARAVALAYDWLHPALTPEQRTWIVDGLDRRAIAPFFQAVESGDWWVNALNNWMTCIVGGLGVVGMALAGSHPRSAELIDFSLPRMRGYLDTYGREGEFNESPFYANATQYPVAYFMALRYHTRGKDEHLANWPFPQTLRWAMHCTLPPGRVAAFGDSPKDAPPSVSHVPAVAAATRDGVLQWFYLAYHDRDAASRLLPLELLWYDPTVEPLAPEHREVRGRAFRDNGQVVASRTDWQPASTACVVYGKGGAGTENHGHHDAGQVCIDGYGERLIVDLGSPSNYPPDFFGPDRYRYYNASVWGHNVLFVGGWETRTGEEHRAILLGSEFDEERGGWWQFDLTPLYDAAHSIRRTVVHLHPGVVVVVDDAQLAIPAAVSLRWHTAVESVPDEEGRFGFAVGDVHLRGRVECLGAPAGTRALRQFYIPPFDRGRLGEPLDARGEPFIEIGTLTHACRFVTTFGIFGPGQSPEPWRRPPEGWTLDAPEGLIDVRVTPDRLRVWNPVRKSGWDVRLT